MDNEGYRGEGTPGGRWGCTIAAIVGVPLMVLAILVGTLGDCIPEEPCRHAGVWWLLLLALLAAAVTGALARAAINALARRFGRR